jgi:hypothetical protein
MKGGELSGREISSGDSARSRHVGASGAIARRNPAGPVGSPVDGNFKGRVHRRLVEKRIARSSRAGLN